MDGNIPLFNPARLPYPVRMQQPPFPMTSMPSMPINLVKKEAGANGAQMPLMYNYFGTPAQFQLPAGFQQLPDAVPIKQEPMDPSMQPQHLQLQQPPQQPAVPEKSKAKKKKIKKEPTIRSGNIPIKEEEGLIPKKKLKQEKITEHLPTVKKKRDRFNGMPEEEVVLRLLPDHLAENLDIVIVGINPGLFAAYVGHHYAGPGNHFWKCLYLSGLIPEPMNAYQDFELPKFGIGFTNICARTTRGSADLKKPEIQEGAKILREKLKKWRPKIAAFNGKGIYEVYCGNKNFILGKQPEPIEGTDTIVYVMPSSSARCAQLPRAVDKVPFYLGLKKLRDHARGDTQHLDESEVSFPHIELKIKTEPKTEPVDGTEGGENSQEKKPQIKAKSKSKKSANPPKTSQSENIPTSSSQPQSTNGMWPVVKQEKSYDPNEYGGQSFTTQSSAVNIATSQMLPVSQMMTVQQPSHIYTHGSHVTEAQASNIATNKPASTSASSTSTVNTSNVFYTGVQQVYQDPSFNAGSFMQQLQDSTLSQASNQSWPDFNYTSPQIIDASTSQAGESSSQDSTVAQVKTEPQEYGYTEISFNNM